MALRLFEHPLSPYARKVKIGLYEKGLPFERIFVDPGSKSDDAVYQEFVMTSPRREVPCLVDGDVRIFDSGIILDYVDERWPQPGLMPDEPAERARVRMLEEMMDTEYEAVNWGLGELEQLRSVGGAKVEQLRTRASLQLQRLWNRLEREFEGRKWLNGARFGRGDIAAYAHVSTSLTLGHGVGERHPRLLSWQARCAERGSVAEEAVELAAGLRRHRAPAVRQYRDHRLEWMMKTGGVEFVLDGLEKGTVRFACEYE